MNKYPLLILLLFLLVLSGCSLAEDVTPPPNAQLPTAEMPQPEQASNQLYPFVRPDPSAGAAIYAEKCSPCHGVSGLGDGPRAAQLSNPVPAIGATDIARASTPAEWYRIVTEGNLERFMPPFESLSDRQRWDTVAYLYSLTLPDRSLESGAELFQNYCADCHGQSGEGNGTLAGNLAIAPRSFTDLEYMVERSTEDFYQVISQGEEPGMPAFIDQLNESERWVLSDYVRSLIFALPEKSPGESNEVAEGSTLQITPEAMSAPSTSEEDMDQDSPISEEQNPQNQLGSVIGSLVNTTGERLPSDMLITLLGFDQMQQVISETTTIRPDGRFEFMNIEMPPGRIFLATTDFDGVTYGSEIGTAHADGLILELPIVVYESTTDISDVMVDRLHLFFEFLDESTLRVVELYVISNRGNQTVVAAEPGLPVLTFDLPSDAANLEFQDGVLGGRYVLTERGFGDTASIRPGMSNYQVLFTYTLPYDRKLQFSRPMPLDAEAIIVLTPQNGVKVKGDGLEDLGVRDAGGEPYQMYSRSSLSAAQALELTLSGKPSNGIDLSSGTFPGVIIGAAVFGLTLIGIGIWLYRRTQFVNAVPETQEYLPGKIGVDEQDADTIMDAIIALDDLYREGKLPESAYQQRREELRARLKKKMGE